MLTDRGRDTALSNVVEETADGGDYCGLKYSGIYRGKATDINHYRLYLPEIVKKSCRSTIAIKIESCKKHNGFDCHPKQHNLLFIQDRYGADGLLFLCLSRNSVGRDILSSH